MAPKSSSSPRPVDDVSHAIARDDVIGRSNRTLQVCVEVMRERQRSDAGQFTITLIG